MEEDLQRIRKALHRGFIARNTKTALTLGVAVSGAIISTQVMAVTIVLTIASLYLLKLKKNTTQKRINDLNIIDNIDHERR